METITGSGCYGFADSWAPGYPAPECLTGYEIPTDGCGGVGASGDLSLPVLASISMAEMNKQCLASRWYYYRGDDFLQASGGRQDDGFAYQQSLGYEHGKYAGHQNLHPSTIARRNERERNRVKTINSTFAKLRQHLPCSAKNKKLSKVQILRSAIQYINQLQHILDAQEEERRRSGGSRTDAGRANGEPDGGEVTSSADSPKAFDSEVDSQPTSVLSAKSLPSVTSSHVSSLGEDDRELIDDLSDWMK